VARLRIYPYFPCGYSRGGIALDIFGIIPSLFSVRRDKAPFHIIRNIDKVLLFI